MDISGIIQSYDSRAASTAALSRGIMAPQYVTAHSYPSAPQNNMAVSHQQLQQNPFSFNAYPAGNSTPLVHPFAVNYIRQRPLPHLVQTDNDGSRSLSFPRNNRQGYIEEHHSQSPPIKTEPRWNTPNSASSSAASSFVSTSTKTITSTTPVNGATEVTFGTEVDTLMKAIQAKAQATSPQTSSIEQKRPVVGAPLHPPFVQVSPKSEVHSTRDASNLRLTYGELQEEPTNAKGTKKRYLCTIEGCTKSFYQKTHLDIHERAHTGAKPYVGKSTYVPLEGC